MINLIPQYAQTKVRHEYWLRVLSVWSFVISVSLLILSVLTIPVYVLVTMQLNAQVNLVGEASEERTMLAESEVDLRLASDMARMVVGGTEYIELTNHISEVTTIAGSAIDLTSYRLDSATAKPTLVISGIAETREVLAQFRDNLEQNARYDGVELPIASLIKDEDIDFNITLTISENS